MNLFVASTKDMAGMNIANQLVEYYNFERFSETYRNNPTYAKKLHNKEVKLILVNSEIVDTQFLENRFSPELIIFLSRHSSAKAIATLSVHTPGNLAEAKFGGKPKTVSVSSAIAMKAALQKMAKLVEEERLDYAVSYECTHHGPSLNVAAMFVELGSSPEQWKDIRAAQVVAQAAVAAISAPSVCPVALGVGGPHYNAKFTKMALDNQRAFGHILPKYALDEVDAGTIKHCVERTLEPLYSVVLDWNGIPGKHKARLIAEVESLKLRYEKI